MYDDPVLDVIPLNTGPISEDEWTRVTLEVDERERRLFVNGELRHSWQADFAGTRSRVGIGLLRSSLTVRELQVQSPPSP